MKNLTHYFTDNLKDCRSKSAVSEIQHTNLCAIVSDDQIFKNKCIKNNSVVADFPRCSSSIESHRSKESNAFQILMTQSKPIHYIEQNCSPIKSSEELFEVQKKLKSCREKLTSLADKKGYSKRKLAELNEGNKIEKAIENRIKAYKVDNKRNNLESPVNNQKHSSCSLLNYFSKSSVDIVQKNELVSTIVVKADVHNPETSMKTVSINKTSMKVIKSNVNKSLYDLDHIEVLKSKNIEEEQQMKKNKPRWSLRIKLHSSEDLSSSAGESETNENELFSPRSRMKLKSSVTKLPEKNFEKLIIEENVIEEKKNDLFNVEAKLPQKRSARLSNKKNEILKEPITLTSHIKKKQHSSAKNSSNTGNEIINAINAKELEPIDIEIMDKYFNNSDTKRKPNEKLAPLFVKRRKGDPAVMAARKLFLQSDITEDTSKKIPKKISPVTTSFLPFPTISHVTQLDENLKKVQVDFSNISIKKISKYNVSFDIGQFKSLNNYTWLKKRKNIDNLMKANVEDTLTELEIRCPDARMIWKNISYDTRETFKISSKARGKKQKNSKTLSPKIIDNNHIENIWPYKYKPIKTDDIVGNEESALKLRNWLNAWTSVKEDYSSSDEFYLSDYSSSKSYNNQVAVLLGPHGSGKSASVYAVAEELGYTVLEVNASSKRTGRKILKDLEEATKSHRIKKGNSQLPNQYFQNNTTKNVPHNSLILFEDIDLIFDEDEGFVSATYQLASNTKRPIVMTCRDICPHLNKMAPQQEKIYFHSISGNRAVALLELISLAETGYKLPINCLDDLLEGGDLRKALIQLQYLLITSSIRFSKQSLLNGSMWRDMRHYLYKPAIKYQKKQISMKSSELSKFTSNKELEVLNKLALSLDSLSLVSRLVDVKDLAFNELQVKLHDSLSLVPNSDPYSSLHSLSSEIAEWISNKTMYDKASLDCTKNPSKSDYLLKQKLNWGVDHALSPVTLTLDRQVIATDYLPQIRTICRAEEQRSSSQSKRGNRFYHYLQGLRLPSTTIKPNILAAACKAMQEKSKD
ncbi:enhanced level of genomic instability 1 [Prorops nasuta]|uniref:enhanced level of genomic instability 1 n=1 Tax=Prorops nasuta TaxID=863751 RepID=UPI0034D01AC1